MQFKYPEILWALLLLLIPIFIHLFQLRRFKKTPFTNVKFLKKIVSTARKSSTLKKWLILFARMGIIAALVLAFAGPFTAKENALKPKSYVFFLDNSFSMQQRQNNGTLLQKAVQTFAQNVPENATFSLFTNTETFRNVGIEDIKNQLLNISFTGKQLSLSEILLKGDNLFPNAQGTQRNLVLVSDFQEHLKIGDPQDSPLKGTQVHLVDLRPSENANSAIDTVFMEKTALGKWELVAQLSSTLPQNTLAVSLYNSNELVAKTAAKFRGQKAQVRFTLPEQGPINGRVVIADNGLDYDNTFYFNIDRAKAIRALAVNGSDPGFLSKIYTPEEFAFQSTSLAQLNYSDLELQNIFILNELALIPNALAMALRSFMENGGSVVVIPPAKDMDMPSYNAFLAGKSIQFSSVAPQEMAIAQVSTAHPLFLNVFEGDVSNFQYPKVNSYYNVDTRLPAALQLQNTHPFLVGDQQLFVFTAALSQTNSNFKNSPLIVPTFYNMGKESLKLPPLYATIGNPLTVEVPISVSQDNILAVAKEGTSFIPQQQVLPKKVRLLFGDLPEEAGVYAIENKGEALRGISFNYDRSESDLTYADLDKMPYAKRHGSLPAFFEDAQKNSSINEFWKWFVILALTFVLLETALHRFLK